MNFRKIKNYANFNQIADHAHSFSSLRTHIATGKHGKIVLNSIQYTG